MASPPLLFVDTPVPVPQPYSTHAGGHDYFFLDSLPFNSLLLVNNFQNNSRYFCKEFYTIWIQVGAQKQKQILVVVLYTEASVFYYNTLRTWKVISGYFCHLLIFFFFFYSKLGLLPHPISLNTHTHTERERERIPSTVASDRVYIR